MADVFDRLRTALGDLTLPKTLSPPIGQRIPPSRTWIGIPLRLNVPVKQPFTVSRIGVRHVGYIPV